MNSVSQRLNSRSAARGLTRNKQTSKRGRIFHEKSWEIDHDTSVKLTLATFSFLTAQPFVNDSNKACLKSGIVWVGRILVGFILKLSTHTE